MMVKCAMELGRFGEAEGTLANLVQMRPDDVTLKLAFASLFRKMNKPKSDVFSCYDSVVVWALAKGDNDMLRKHMKAWFDNVDDEVIADRPLDLRDRLEGFAKAVTEDSHVQLVLQLLKQMIERGSLNYRLMYQVVKHWVASGSPTVEAAFPDFEAKLFREFEIESSDLTSSFRVRQQPFAVPPA